MKRKVDGMGSRIRCDVWLMSVVVMHMMGELGMAYTATNRYHTNRVFRVITSSIPGTVTAYKVYDAARRLTTVVGPTNVLVDTNRTVAREYEVSVWGYGTAEAAWGAVVASVTNYGREHTHAIYGNAGWVKGTREAHGEWGGYLWWLENEVAFETSATNIWVSPYGVTNYIARVLVGTIGDYEPMTNVVDRGPRDVERLTNYAGAGVAEDALMPADYRAFYVLLKVELEFQNSKMSSGKVIDPYTPPTDVRIGVVVGDTVTFKAKLTPAVTLANSDYVWSGAQSGNGPTIAITFANVCNYAEGLSVLGCPNRVAAITAMEVPPPNQGTWTALHLPSAVTAYNLGMEALAWAQANWSALGGSSDVHNCRADAARHCYWNVLMSVEMDTGTAEDAGTAHERTNIENGDPHNESVMDLHNNAVGRSISSGLTTNRTDCQNAVINALNSGTLWILDDLPNINEVGLIKPSNQ